MNNEAIGQKLIELRGKKTREEVANTLKISVSALAMYELGKRTPRDEVKIRIAKYYKKSVQNIFFNQ